MAGFGVIPKERWRVVWRAKSTILHRPLNASGKPLLATSSYNSRRLLLQYLRVSLHGAILDTLRAYQRPREVSLPEPGTVGEPSMEDVMCDSELWDILKGLFSNPREQRLAYLLFYCGLGPREIVHYCSPEWSSVQEIYVLRRTIMVRVLRHMDTLRWRLS
jgi:hypothetical protein